MQYMGYIETNWQIKNRINTADKSQPFAFICNVLTGVLTNASPHHIAALLFKRRP